MQKILSQVLTEIASALRFRWYGVLTTWIICAAGWAWVALQPNIYEATARVYVDTSSVLEPVLGNQIVAPNVDDQLAYVHENLLGREQLETVARVVGLDVNAQDAVQREVILQGLRNNVRIASTGRTRNTPDSIYTINYRNPDRGRAVAVVDTLLNNFVENTLGANRQQGDTAGQFLDQRVEEYEARLALAEQALADFKKSHSQRLPGAEGDYFQRMQAERDALTLAYRDMRILESKKAQLAEQVSGEAPVVASLVDADNEPPPNSIDARIRDLELELDSLLLVYTEIHPDVQAAQRQLARLRDQRAEQLAALGVDNENQELQGLAANPAYQTLIAAIAETDVEMAALRADIDEREARVGALQALIDEVPEVEAQLARLNRDYNVIYEQYLALVRSRETQELSRQAAETDQIDFRVINPPLAAFTPVAPNRLFLLTAVFAFAVGAGGALCWLLAQIWPVFVTRDSLRVRVGLPVLGVVTNAWKVEQRRRKFIGVVLISSAYIGLGSVYVGLVGLELVGPGIHDILASLGVSR